MSKIFHDTEARKPKVAQHPAHQRAAEAFGPDALKAAEAAAGKAPPPLAPPRQPVRFKATAIGPTSIPGSYRRRSKKRINGVHRKPKPLSPPVVPLPKVLPRDPATTPAGALKQTALPSTAARTRLRQIRRRYRKAESFVGAYALKCYFDEFNDTEIAARLHAQGHGLRRSAKAAPPGTPLSVYISTEDRHRLETLYDEHAVASALVTGDAIDWLLARETDEGIANALSQAGLGLRRARSSKTSQRNTP